MVGWANLTDVVAWNFIVVILDSVIADEVAKLMVDGFVNLMVVAAGRITVVA